MALCLVGKAGTWLIWAWVKPVMSQEAPIPLAPCSKAAQSNHTNPNQGDVLQKYLEKRTAFTVYKEEVSELPTIVTWIGMADYSRRLIFEKDYWILFKLGSLPLVSSDNLTQLKYGANYIHDSYGIIVENYSRA